ncbi:MAG: beta-aspartyl-peptidase (threonine type) [Saprospiraceae bacterium]|jgi:beta-aspartyl-peptidase (threonine type)
MKQLTLLIMLCCLVVIGCNDVPTVKTMEAERPAYTIVIHGGAGTILKKNMTPEKDQAYRDAMNEALDIGETILKSGGNSIDAVEKTINFMENSELFNAGKGAVFTHEGKNEMDASIMFGKDQNAGAVGGVTNIKHPISAARAVLEKSDHVMMAGKGAEDFAEKNGIEIVDPAYFKTDRRWESLQRILKAEKEESELSEDDDKNKKHGTVGCVALDQAGNITAGTSTGGMTNKKYNRLGDSPIIGAGTYADNATCGVSCTGHGEFFIRYTVARDIAAMMEYGGKSLAESAHYIINEKLVAKGGDGGIVALDQNGNVAMNFNTAGMYRAFAKPGERVVKIYKEED